MALHSHIDESRLAVRDSHPPPDTRGKGCAIHYIPFVSFVFTQRNTPPFGYFSLGAARCLSNGVIARAPVLETRRVAFGLLRTRRDIGVVARRFRKNDAPRRALVSHTRANGLPISRAFLFTWCCAPWCIRIHVSLCDTLNAIRPCILNPSNYAETFLFSSSLSLFFAVFSRFRGDAVGARKRRVPARLAPRILRRVRARVALPWNRQGA